MREGYEVRMETLKKLTKEDIIEVKITKIKKQS